MKKSIFVLIIICFFANFIFFIYNAKNVMDNTYEYRVIKGTALGVQEIETYKNGIPDGTWIRIFIFGITHEKFKNGNLVETIQYDNRGNEIARCAFKNNQPESGTIWLIISGVDHVKFNQIVTFKNGEELTCVDLDRTELENIFQFYNRNLQSRKIEENN